MLVKLKWSLVLLLAGLAFGQSNAGTPSADVRDTGTDVTGATETSAKLQLAVNAACGSNGSSTFGQRLSAPSGAIKISSTINFTQCGGIDFGGASTGNGQAGQSTAINWSGGNTGTMFLLNRTRDTTIENLTVGGLNSSNVPNIVFDLDETTGSGILSHNFFSHVNIGLPGGTQNTNFRGIRIGQTAPGNTEQQVFQDVNVNCGGGTLTDTSNGDAWAINLGTGTAQPFYVPILRAEISGCSHGVEVNNNTRDVILDGGNYGPNFHSLYLRGGGNVAFENIVTTLDVSSSIFLNGYAGHLWVKNNAFTGSSTPVIDITNAAGGAKTTIEHNDFGGAQMLTGAFLPGSATGFLTAIGNSNFTGCPTQATASFGMFLYNMPTSGTCDNVFVSSAGVPFDFASRNDSLQNSPPVRFEGAYQNSSTPTFATDYWQWQTVVSSGLNGQSKFTLGHSGSAGALPLDLSAATAGIILPSSTFANLPSSPANGTLLYCSDCKNVTDDTTGTFDSAAASGGHGTNVLRENGAWRVH